MRLIIGGLGDWWIGGLKSNLRNPKSSNPQSSNPQSSNPKSSNGQQFEIRMSKQMKTTITSFLVLFTLAATAKSPVAVEWRGVGETMSV